MTDEQKSGKATNAQDTPIEEQSPNEKLTDTEPATVPGAENPESTEIKRETNLNTE